MKMTIFFLVTGTLFFTSCTKSVDTPEENQLNFSEEDLAYVQMQPGKYFIYKDSATGNTDSVVVTESTLETKIQPATTNSFLGLVGINPSYRYQLFTILYFKMNGSSSTVWFSGVAKADNLIANPSTNKNKSDLWLTGKDPLTNSYGSFVFIPKYLNGKKQTIPNLTIEGKDYTDVRQFTVNIAIYYPSSYKSSSIYYWAKGMGIIKKTITTDNTTQTWTLVRNG